MYPIYKKIINFIGLIPFMRYLLKVFYLWALKKVKELSLEIDEIEDILLISKLDHKNFIYGQSDLNLVFIVKDNSHPKKVLELLKKKILGLWPANILVNTYELSVFKKSEIDTPLIRSYLVKTFFTDEVKWKSICTKEIYSFDLKAQDHYSIQSEYVKSIEKFIFRINNNFLVINEEFRSHAKRIYNSITGLKKYNLIKKDIPKKWFKLAQKIMSFSFFKKSKLDKFKFNSLELLDGMEIDKRLKKEYPDHYNPDLIELCLELINEAYIFDTFLAPALIQLDSEEIKGRIYVDVIIKSQFLKRKEYDSILFRIKNFQKKQNNLKYFFNISTYEIYHIKDDHCLADYPLRGIYRAQQGHSFNDYKYDFSKDKKQIEKAAIHYLLNQFMNFRSKDFQKQLVGSKFIKSLNIIYQYKLLLEFLQGKEFAVSHNYKSIIEDLGVQLQSLEVSEVVNENNWPIVRAQMLYILKQIRDELSKSYASLKNLQF